MEEVSGTESAGSGLTIDIASTAQFNSTAYTPQQTQLKHHRQNPQL
jgi:hypothetical protein